MRALFDVTVTEHPYRAVVAVSGELDVGTCPFVTEATDALSLRGQTLILELSGATFMDSTGLAMLLQLRERARHEDGRLEVCGIDEPVKRVLERTGAFPLFTTVPSL
ncbi:STAS domain-containing protein [Streptomyces xanthochromogenes]|uniref:STAS domain-containing protein n=1 Tax=Streptomyces xanthochromogenes TaxID=67384 RepID=UPI00380A5D85